MSRKQSFVGSTKNQPPSLRSSSHAGGGVAAHAAHGGDGESGNRSFARHLDAHPTVYRLAAGTFVLCLAIGLAIGLTSVFDAAAEERQDKKEALDAFAGSWRTRIATRFSEAISLSTATAMFAAGGATSVPDHNGTKAERMQFINNASWELQGPRLFEQVPGILSIQLQAGGIISQFYPPGSAPLGLDIFALPAAAVAYREMVANGVNVVQGPFILVQGGWGLLVRTPVYLGATIDMSSFWGAATIVFRVPDLLAAMNFTADFDRDGYDYTVFRRHKDNLTRADDLIMTSRPNASASVIDEGLTFNIPLADPRFALFLAFAPKSPIPSGNPAAGSVIVIAVIVLCATLVAVALVFLLALVAHTVRHAAVPHRSVQPTLMALVSVKSMTWWKEHADAEQLHDDLRRFEKKTAALAASHGCHASGSVSDGCVLVVASDAGKLRSFAAAVRAKLVVESKATLTAAAGKYEGRSSRSHTSTSKRSHASTQLTQSSGQAGATASSTVPFVIGVALHVGPLRAAYDAALDHFTFHGGGIAAAARAVDATRGGEVSATDDFADAHPALAQAPVRTECLDDEIIVYVLEAAAAATSHGTPLGTSLRPSNSRSPRGFADERADDSSVATSLSAQTGTVLRKVVAVLIVELIPAAPRSKQQASGGGPAAPSKSETAIPRYPEVLKAVAGIVKDHSGEIVATTDTTVTVLFNARVATSAAATRAVHADEALRVSLQARGVGVVSAVATGACHVATVVDGHVMCVGAPMTRARWLHAHALAVARGPAGSVDAHAKVAFAPSDPVILASPDHPAIPSADESVSTSADSAGAGATPFTRTCVVDGVSVEVLRQAFEVQCIGPVFAGDGTHLAYTVEREWDVEQDDEWLYRLQQMEQQSAFSGLNAAFEGLKANPASAEAREAAAAVLRQPRPAEDAGDEVSSRSVDSFALQRLAATLLASSHT